MAALVDDDVLLLILQHLGRDDKRQRRAALCAVCLASRRLRALAQPVLWHRVSVDSYPTFVKLLLSAARTGYGQHTRVYTVLSADDTCVPLVDAINVAALFPRIEDMFLIFGNIAPALPQLEQHKRASILLHPPVFLDYVISYLHPSGAHHNWADGSSPPVLFDLEVCRELPRHTFLAIYPHLDTSPIFPIRLLDKAAALVHRVRPASPGAHIVIFATRPVLDLALENRDVDRALGAFLSACSTKGVRIEWVGAPGAKVDEDECVREFARYARALKAAAGEDSARG
ncbi:hypothetical protein JCM8208_004414 [Rhodotorula glutinis]